MSDKPVLLRIPSELFEALETMANITGQSMEDIVQEAMIEAYGSPYFLLKLAMPKQLQQLQQQLDKLACQMEILSESKSPASLLTPSEWHSLRSHPSRVQRLEAAEQN